MAIKYFRLGEKTARAGSWATDERAAGLQGAINQAAEIECSFEARKIISCGLWVIMVSSRSCRVLTAYQPARFKTFESQKFRLTLRRNQASLTLRPTGKPFPDMC